MKIRFLTVVSAVVVGVAALLAGMLRAGDSTSPAGAAVAPTSGSETVVFYFHGNARCATCKTIEAYTDEAVHAAFAGELEDGAIEWRVVNVDETENRHFIQDFQLMTRSVVLAEYRAGKVVRFENLEQVWQLVRNKQRFVDYVQSKTKAFLAAG
jgi:hypothetical protein